MQVAQRDDMCLGDLRDGHVAGGRQLGQCPLQRIEGLARMRRGEHLDRVHRERQRGAQAADDEERRFWGQAGVLGFVAACLVGFSTDSFATSNMWVMFGVITAAGLIYGAGEQDSVLGKVHGKRFRRKKDNIWPRLLGRCLWRLGCDNPRQGCRPHFRR